VVETRTKLIQDFARKDADTHIDNSIGMSLRKRIRCRLVVIGEDALWAFGHKRIDLLRQLLDEVLCSI
jgi:hypothetical protein